MMRSSREKSGVSRTRQGFSLIELSIVVAILSVVSVMGLEVATSFLSNRAYETTKVKLAEVDRALRDFYWVYGRLPCPSHRNLAPTSSNYGFEDCTAPAVWGTTVLYGAIPFRTLNLQVNASLDSYSSKFNYMVPQVLTPSSTSFNANNGNIEIRSGRLQQPCTTNCVVLATDAIYAVFSAGADKRGATSVQGVNINSCAATNDQRIDAKNCIGIVGGGPLNPSTIPATVLYDSRYNAGTQVINYFDDIIVWRRKSQL